MPQPKKDAVKVYMKMNSTVHDKLGRYCAKTGLTKTAAVEHILTEFFEADEYIKAHPEHLANR